RLETLTHVDLVLYEGKNLDMITQVSIIEAFPSLREDLDRVVAAGTMIEIADVVAQENEPARRLFLLLRRGLRSLEESDPHPDLVTAYLLNAAAIVGVAPALEHCAGCGARDVLTRFSFAAGGVLCDRCRTPGSYALRSGVVEYLASLAGADLSALPDPDLSMSREAMGVARRFMEYHLERKLDSMALIDV
ncbi:MAG: DNA repair protein RecO, partial [Actinomycetota bacterium]|nr:DNA repair protein RecO [Actinomycetota bacterium]